jgi:hypothetical protein
MNQPRRGEREVLTRTPHPIPGGQPKSFQTLVRASLLTGPLEINHLAVVMTKPASLGEFEQVVLLAILSLDENAYRVTIRSEIAACTGREAAPGTLCTTLDRMEDKSSCGHGLAMQPRSGAGGRNDISRCMPASATVCGTG